MPGPDIFDSQSFQPPLMCRACVTLMRIETIEAVDGRERIKLICDDCGAR